MKPWLIHFWHGRVPNESLFFQKIENLCRKDAVNNLWWDGTLDEFLNLWGEKFMILPATYDENAAISGRICVTPRGGWGCDYGD